MDSPKKKKIFLIDDEHDFTELTRALFEFQGFEVEAVNDPLEGFERLQATLFDAIVVDIMMPEMDGLTLVSKVRKINKYKKTPLFILSAKKLESDERKQLLNQNVHFIAKPFEPQRLVEIVADSLF